MLVLHQQHGAPPWLEDLREEAAGAEFGDREWDVAHLGGEQSRPAVVAVAAAFLGALIAIRTEDGGGLPFDQMLEAMACQFEDQLPSAAATQ